MFRFIFLHFQRQLCRCTTDLVILLTEQLFPSGVVNPIQHGGGAGGGAKSPHHQFFPYSINVGISSQNIVTFSYNSFATPV